MGTLEGQTKAPALENLYLCAVTAGDNEPWKHIDKIMSDSGTHPVSEARKGVNVQHVARGASEREDEVLWQ